jgi:hypothetical protein
MTATMRAPFHACWAFVSPAPPPMLQALAAEPEPLLPPPPHTCECSRHKADRLSCVAAVCAAAVHQVPQLLGHAHLSNLGSQARKLGGRQQAPVRQQQLAGSTRHVCMCGCGWKVEQEGRNRVQQGGRELTGVVNAAI